MFYNARWYDPYITQFSQPDSIVPDPYNSQDWNRYAYARNNPVKYTDPSGHGVDCGIGMGCVRDYSTAKTLQDFQKLGWTERKRWLAEFASDRSLENWFNDMGSAIDFMRNDPSLARKGGTAEVMDAAVLQAINDGWLMSQGEQTYGGGGFGWANFFEKLGTSSDKNSLIVIRLQAEQYGVDYAWSLTSTQSAYNNSSELDQIYFDVFKGGADTYRSAASKFRSDPLTVSRVETVPGIGPWLIIQSTDPRTSGPYLNAVGQLGYYAAVAIWSWGNSVPPPTR